MKQANSTKPSGPADSKLAWVRSTTFTGHTLVSLKLGFFMITVQGDPDTSGYSVQLHGIRTLTFKKRWPTEGQALAEAVPLVRQYLLSRVVTRLEQFQADYIPF